MRASRYRIVYVYTSFSLPFLRRTLFQISSTMKSEMLERGGDRLPHSQRREPSRGRGNLQEKIVTGRWFGHGTLKKLENVRRDRRLRRLFFFLLLPRCKPGQEAKRSSKRCSVLQRTRILLFLPVYWMPDAADRQSLASFFALSNLSLETDVEKKATRRRSAALPIETVFAESYAISFDSARLCSSLQIDQTPAIRFFYPAAPGLAEARNEFVDRVQKQARQRGTPTMIEQSSVISTATTLQRKIVHDFKERSFCFDGREFVSLKDENASATFLSKIDSKFKRA